MLFSLKKHPLQRLVSPMPVAEKAATTSSVLCVDLDGTLIKTDLLYEMLMVVLRTRPLELLKIPLWLRQGKAYTKQRLEQLAPLDVSSLPYRQSLLDYLRDEKARGRKIILATAADKNLATRIAEHVGVFDGVIASDGKRNLSGTQKLDAMAAYSQEAGFVYAGDAAVDMHIWPEAEGAILVGKGERFAAELDNVVRVFSDTPSRKEYFRAIRLHQWAKNALIFVPLLTAHAFTNPAKLGAAVLAFICFGLMASSVYVQNDLLDLEADRKHHRKRHRPFAAGHLSIRHGLALAPLLIVLSLALSLLLPSPFIWVLLSYFALTLSYSFFFKRKPIIDVLLLAILYTVRIVAGGAAVNVPLSPWLLAFSMFFFLSLAFVKRFSELRDLPSESSLKSRGYVRADLEGLADLGVSSGYVSILVVALYISSNVVQNLYATPRILWLLCPVLLYWISRVWLLTRRGNMHDDPVVFALRDRVSYIVGFLVLIIAATATRSW